MSDIVKLERRGQCLEITLDRPKANAIDNATTVELSKAFVSFRDDQDLRVAIITGTGRFFSAGWDLKAAASGEVEEIEVDGGFAGITEMFDLEKPVIAAVNGFAYGGGFEIALACDMIVASQTASFGFPEVKRGLIATSGALFRAPRTLPLNIAREMLLTGGEYPAARMEQIGVVNYVVDPGASLSKAIELASTITENSPVAVQQTTKVLDHIIGDNDDLGWNETKLGREIIEKSEDRAEGVSAFFERRKPNWPGR